MPYGAGQRAAASATRVDAHAHTGKHQPSTIYLYWLKRTGRSTIDCRPSDRLHPDYQRVNRPTVNSRLSDNPINLSRCIQTMLLPLAPHVETLNYSLSRPLCTHPLPCAHVPDPAPRLLRRCLFDGADRGRRHLGARNGLRPHRSSP